MCVWIKLEVRAKLLIYGTEAWSYISQVTSLKTGAGLHFNFSILG